MKQDDENNLSFWNKCFMSLKFTNIPDLQIHENFLKKSITPSPIRSNIKQ